MDSTVARKAVVYCIRDEHLLVFRHMDFPIEETGVQVPKGTIRDGETPRAAALRELSEETGKNTFTVLRFLGRDRFDMSPYQDEVQQRFFFEAIPTEALPDTWVAGEDHDGQQPRTRFRFFWLPLRSAHVLASGQSAMIGRVARHAIRKVS